MYSLVRKTLEIYISEKRIITPADIPSDALVYQSRKDAVFVTLYQDGRVIASSGRIQCQKENTIYECIDITLLCLKDPRFSPALQSPEGLTQVHIRVDIFSATDRRMIQSPGELDTRTE